MSGVCRVCAVFLVVVLVLTFVITRVLGSGVTLSAVLFCGERPVFGCVVGVTVMLVLVVLSGVGSGLGSGVESGLWNVRFSCIGLALLVVDVHVCSVSSCSLDLLSAVALVLMLSWLVALKRCVWVVVWFVLMLCSLFGWLVVSSSSGMFVWCALSTVGCRFVTVVSEVVIMVVG